MLGIILFILISIILIVIVLIAEKLFVMSHRQEINMKKRSRVLFVLATVLAAAILSFGVLIYKTEYEKRIIQTYDSGKHQLIIYEIGEPGFPFGSSKCRLVLLQNGQKIDSIDFHVANDGKHIDEGNFDVRWIDEGISVNVNGEEQEDKVYVLYFEESRLHVLDVPQEFRANFIEWEKDGFRAIVCDPLDNTVFPNGAEVTVVFTEGTYLIDIDGTVVTYKQSRSLFEPSISKKLDWVEGMVIQIEFSGYEGFNRDNGYKNMATGLRIENVDVIAISVD